MGRVRVGVVLLVPEPAAAHIDGLRMACGDPVLGLVPPHITLVPPVNVREGDLDAALGVVRAAAARTSGPLRFELGPVRTFHPATPVLYLAVGGDTGALAALRDAVLAGPLERPSEWPFVPHVTLATEVAADRIAGAVSALSDFRSVVDVDRVYLMQESPDRVWRPLADVALAPPSIIGRGGLPVEISPSQTLDVEGERFFGRAWQQHQIDSYGVAAQPFAVTARREGEVVGVAVGESDVSVRLDRLVVSSAVRGQGIGSQLLAAVEHLAASRGCARLVLVVQAGGPAVDFYRSRGWVIEQELPDWRAGRDFVRMVRTLSATPSATLNTS
jgi:2'-5' RNA ligase/ribosomal protein S18 acetylase RimI-like enzyme